MKDCMLDIETLGTSVNACIVQIGACYFDRDTGEIGKTFKVNVDPRTSVTFGGVIDPETILWWFKQSDAARNSVTTEGVNINTSLYNLNTFLTDAKAIWSHATFDYVIILAAFRRSGILPTFKYQAARDIRTLMDLAGTTKDRLPREGTHHDALDDCLHQVKYCVEAFKRLRIDL